MNSSNKLVVGWRGLGFYSVFTITNILKIAYPNIEFEWTNDKDPDLIIDSQSNSLITVPYISWSGESYPSPINPNNKPPICQIYTTIKEFSFNEFFIPYVHNYISEKNMVTEYNTNRLKDWVLSDYNVSEKLKGSISSYHDFSIERPFFICYITSNRVWERETFFNILRSKVGDSHCHSLGRCSNNLHLLDEKIRNKVKTYTDEKSSRDDYRENEKILKNYRFSIVMENTKRSGYVTEKIINAFRSGSIPVYWGGDGYAETIFNSKAFINISNFSTFDEAANYIITLNNDKERLRKMREEHIFKSPENIPDIFKGIESEYLSKVAKCIKSQLKLEHVSDKSISFIRGIDMVYWINLDTSQDRRRNMEKIVSEFDVPNTRIKAVDGKNDETLMSHFILGSSSIKTFSRSQYGCLLSHLKTISQFYESSYQTVMILEDDISLECQPYWTETLQDVMKNAPHDWEVIMLSYMSTTDFDKNYTRWSIGNPKGWMYDINSAISYVINRRGAKKIIDELWDSQMGKWRLGNKYNHVADEIVYGYTQTYVYKYPFFIWPDSNTSTIRDDENGDLEFHRIMKEHVMKTLKNRPQRREFIHYFENGSRVFSETGGERIAREARELKDKDGNPFFDKVSTFRKKDLGEDFVCLPHFSYKRGAGYYVWKSRIVQLSLKNMNWGDQLLYADSGCEIKGSLQPLFDLLKEQDIVSFHLGDYHKEEMWTKNDLFEEMKLLDKKYKESPHCLASYFLIRKTKRIVEFFDEYVNLCINLHLVDDSPSVTPNSPFFKEHRHDQSVLSLLIKKYGFSPYPDCGWPVDLSTTISASRRCE
jgi:hypothetical protein